MADFPPQVSRTHCYVAVCCTPTYIFVFIALSPCGAHTPYIYDIKGRLAAAPYIDRRNDKAGPPICGRSVMTAAAAMKDEIDLPVSRAAGNAGGLGSSRRQSESGGGGSADDVTIFAPWALRFLIMVRLVVLLGAKP